MKNHAASSFTRVGPTSDRVFKNVLIALWVLLPLCITLLAPDAKAQEGSRSRRVGTRNILFAGGGLRVSNHPNYERPLLPSLTFQRRILRRDVRVVPLWVRAGAEYTVDRTRFRGYTVWSVQDNSPFAEDVTERMRDITIRGELIADLLNSAGSRYKGTYYMGAGVAMHQLHFNSNGRESGIPTFSVSQSQASFTVLAGSRLSAVQHSVSLYLEARFGRLYGKTHHVDTTQMPIFAEEFEFTHVVAVSLETGLGVHW